MLYPITFSIPEEKVINYIPSKTKLLSDLIPGKIETYIYNNEKDYFTALSFGCYECFGNSVRFSVDGNF
jgi:hypothetical protein